MKKRISPSLLAFFLACIFLISSAFYVKKWEQGGSMALISWDVSGYYMYLPGIFYDDLGKLNNQKYIIDRYHPCEDFLNEYISPTGNYVIKYSSGMALLYLPGFLAGHLYARFGNYPVDGFSYPYQFSMAIYSLLISFLGLWMCRKLLLRYFSETVTAIVILSLVFASNYLNYAGISNMFSHNYLFTIYLLIIYLSIQWTKSFDYKHAVFLGILCGLAALTRPTEVISVIIPLFWGVGGWADLKQRISVLFVQRKKLIVLFATSILIGSVQLIYWKIYAGRFLYWSYGDNDELNFLKVHFWNGLFSYRKGWFAYTPVMILSIAGFITLYRQFRNLFWVSFVFTFIAIYIVFSWKDWAYGGSFTMRAVIQYYAILIFPFASFITYAIKRRVIAIPTFAFLVFCAWLNIIMTCQANVTGIMESDNMTGAYYWRIFGKLHIKDSDRRLLYVDEEMPESLAERLYTVLSKDFAIGPSAIEVDGRNVFAFNSKTEFVPETTVKISGEKNSWYRGYFEIYIKSWEPNRWKQGVIYAWLLDQNGNYKKRENYRMQILAKYQKWDTVYVDIKIPKDFNEGDLKFGIYNPHSDSSLYVRSMWVDKVKE